ncbi:hypothetical protein B0H11DRAFT_2204656 [Mycena galericulata]|nr:hypothetical protein B0H11DRAFT_2204656 [Mycena galericulata]
MGHPREPLWNQGCSFGIKIAPRPITEPGAAYPPTRTHSPHSRRGPYIGRGKLYKEQDGTASGSGMSGTWARPFPRPRPSLDQRRILISGSDERSRRRWRCYADAPHKTLVRWHKSWKALQGLVRPPHQRGRRRKTDLKNQGSGERNIGRSAAAGRVRLILSDEHVHRNHVTKNSGLITSNKNYGGWRGSGKPWHASERRGRALRLGWTNGEAVRERRLKGWKGSLSSRERLGPQ